MSADENIGNRGGRMRSYGRSTGIVRTAALFFSLLFGCIGFGARCEEVDIVYAEGEASHSACMRLGFFMVHTPVEDLTITLSEDLRMRDNFTKFDMSLTTADLTYNVNKYFRFGAGYSFFAIYMDGKAASSYATYWSLRHRIYAHVTGRISAGDFKFDLRERLLCTWNTDPYLDSRATPNPRVELRTRLKISYDTHKPVSPYVHVEMRNPLTRSQYAPNDWISKLEYVAGISYKINAHNSINFFYLLSQDLGQSVSINDAAATVKITKRRGFEHIVGVYYYFRF